MMNKHHRRRSHDTAKRTLLAIAVFMAGSILLLWSWNTLAVDLFQFPEARFKHAVAFAGLMAGGFLFPLFVARIVSNGPYRSGHCGGVVS
jgi:hypothetical protein